MLQPTERGRVAGEIVAAQICDEQGTIRTGADVLKRPAAR